jgi:hypothetical protein
MSRALPARPGGSDLAKAIDYILKRWAAFTLLLDDGRVCLSNNAAERALRGITLGRKSCVSPVPTAAGNVPQQCTA